ALGVGDDRLDYDVHRQLRRVAQEGLRERGDLARIRKVGGSGQKRSRKKTNERCLHAISYASGRWCVPAQFSEGGGRWIFWIEARLITWEGRMRRALAVLGTTVTLLVFSLPLSARMDTIRIMIKGGQLTAPVEI